MKTVTSLVAALLLVVSMSAVSYACGSGENCSDGSSHNLSDKIFFYNDHVTDANGSPTPIGALNTGYVDGVYDKGYGGMNANVLESPTDYVKWIHNFNFSPSVQNPGGILNASLSISLVNYALSGKDEHGNEYGDRDHEEDQDHKDEYVDGKLKERNKKQVSDGNGGTKDDRREHSIDLGCLYTNNTLATNALIRLEGNSAWFNIPSINGDSDFEVVLTKLYDGIFAVEIKSTMSDFILEWSKLDIEYCSAAPVPEPSTFILLGAGLIGAGLIRRRSSK